MGLFQRIREGLQKTQTRLSQEIKRIVTRSPKLTGETLEELEAALLGADFGTTLTFRITEAVRRSYQSQGASGLDIFSVARDEVEKALEGNNPSLIRASSGLTVVSVVGVNGTGKTTTSAKLAHSLKARQMDSVLAACDTFRAAAIEQLELWGERLSVPVVAGSYNADPAAVAHDAISAAVSRNADYLIVDTAGRLHTKNNLMKELQKVHRVMDRKMPGAPHEVLLVVDATTGMNALTQAREFHKAVQLTGLVITKLDGTSRGGMAVAIQNELRLPIKFIGVGEQADDLQPFDASEYARALFGDATD